MGIKVAAVYPSSNPEFVQFASRRSVVHSTNGMVACTQPLAAEAGQRILKMGGNAAVSLQKMPSSVDFLLIWDCSGCSRSCWYERNIA